MILTRYGYREWVLISTLSFVAASVALLLMWWWAAVAIGVVWLALLSFFRDPPRRIPSQIPQGAMLSPADGVVSAIERLEHHEATQGPAIVIRIFLSVLNVHVNRAPCDAEVVALRYVPGRFLNAQTEESARVNESNLITLRIDRGDGAAETIGVRQVSGMIARRIVCPLKPGQRLRQGQRFGMIKFGSTTELILPRPDDVEVCVEKGSKVRGVRTLLAVLKPPSFDLARDAV